MESHGVRDPGSFHFVALTSFTCGFHLVAQDGLSRFYHHAKLQLPGVEEEWWENVPFFFEYMTQKSHTPLGSHIPCQNLVMQPHLITKHTGKCRLQLCGHLQLQKKGKSDNCMTTKYLCYTAFLPTSQIIFISFPKEENQFWLIYSSLEGINCIPSNSSWLWLNSIIFPNQKLGLWDSEKNVFHFCLTIPFLRWWRPLTNRGKVRCKIQEMPSTLQNVYSYRYNSDISFSW